jgi:hypothetical protein
MPSVPNHKLVTPAERARLAPLLRHYAKSPHPFTACVRDNRKRFGPRTEAVCAVLKDVLRGSTMWRGKGKNLSVAELRDAIDMADASGLDCPSLKRARAVLATAEAREHIDMAKGDPPEDSPAFNWRIHGNRRRGVVLTNGKRVLVSPAQFDKLKKAKLIDTKKTPALKGDSPADAKTSGPTAKAASATKPAAAAKGPAKAAAPLVKHRITRGPRKGQVVEGRVVNGKFHELRTNTEKGNPRRGQKFVALKVNGKKVHRYVRGGKVQNIVVR